MDAVTQKPSLALVRKLKAAPEQVWRALTQPEAMKQWYCPGGGFKVAVAETEIRIGGRLHVLMIAPDGEEHDVSGIYRVVEPHRRLVHTWAWKSTPERESLVTFELRAADGGTELTLKHELFFDEEARDRHQQGWAGCLAQLEKFVA